MTRDPRVDPRPGDVLDDDPPAPPLTVERSRKAPEHVLGARYVTVPGHEQGCPTPDGDPCKGCVCTFVGSWPIDAWRREMADAVVVHVEEVAGA